jgi:hypothetical protein
VRFYEATPGIALNSNCRGDSRNYERIRDTYHELPDGHVETRREERKCEICKKTTLYYLFELNGDLNQGLGLHPEQSIRFYAFQILDASFEVLNSSVVILLDSGTQFQA